MNHFYNLVVAGKHGTGTMWCAHSYLRSCAMVQCKVSIKDFMTLRLRVKRMTQDRMSTTPDVLLYSEIKLGLATLFNEDDDEDVLFKICITITYFGVLYRLEALQVEIKDVTIDEIVSTECPRTTERRKKGLRFKMPNWLVSAFAKHIRQFE